MTGSAPPLNAGLRAIFAYFETKRPGRSRARSGLVIWHTAGLRPAGWRGQKALILFGIFL